ncbi:MAG: hypothetical protein FJ029_02330 [Actinobacteria bacterium]|nr:hypothetical protein [Actinomycetota bacterium]
MAVEIGPDVRLALYLAEGGRHRLLTVGEAPSTMDAPDFDLTPGLAAAWRGALDRAGPYAYPTDGALPSPERVPPVQVITGPGLTVGPTAFVVGNLVARDLERLEATIAGVGFQILGRATTAVRAFRERVDGPAALDVIAAQAPAAIVIALTDDASGESLDYITDLLIGGLAGRETGYMPTIVLLYAGMPEARNSARLEQHFPLKLRTVVGGSPSEPMEMGGPRALLAEVAHSLRWRSFAGLVVPPGLAAARIVPSTEALQAAVRELATQQDLNVAAIALESSQVTAAGFQNGAPALAHFGALDRPGRPLHLGLHTPLERVARWLPDEPLPQALRALVLNRTSRPATAPGSVAELQIEHAIWTTAAREALRDSPQGRSPLDNNMLDLLVLTGGGARTAARPIQAALLLINAVEPWGVTQLATDLPSCLALSGALILANLRVAVESSLTPLGTCVAPRGQGKSGEPAVVVEVHPRSGPTIEREVVAGMLDVIQWDPGAPADVRIWPASKFDIGLGNGRPAQLRSPVEAGLAGLIIDARGRPLAWPDDPDQRRARLSQWYRAVNAYPAPDPRRSEFAHVR